MYLRFPIRNDDHLLRKAAIAAVIVLTSIDPCAATTDKITKETLSELKLNKKSEEENLKVAASAEALITKTEETAIAELQRLIKKYKGTGQEPDLLFRLAELYGRRAKTGRFVDLYKGDKTLSEILTPSLTEKGAKGYLSQSITVYKNILKRYPNYPARDEVLFNLAFAIEQHGDNDEAIQYFGQIIEKHPQSLLLPETHMALGELHFRKQNYIKAQEHFEKVQNWPRSLIAPLALYKSAWCSYNLRDTLTGIAKLEKVLVDSKSSPQKNHIRTEARKDLALFFSEQGESSNAVKYFSRILLENEVGLASLDLATVYERHGKIKDMKIVLKSFLDRYPKDPQAGLLWLKHIEHDRDDKQYEAAIKGIQSTSALCRDKTWATQTAETSQFCETSYPAFLHDTIVEWSESRTKKEKSAIEPQWLEKGFREYLAVEKSQLKDDSLHLIFAHFLFNQNKFSEAESFYEEVGLNESLPPSTLHDARYGLIVSVDKQFQGDAKNKILRQKLHSALNVYIEKSPQGEYINDVYFKKAFLFYDEKEFSQSLQWLARFNPKEDSLRFKKEDLILEIYRVRKDYEGLVTESRKILSVSKGDRRNQILSIYQSGQIAVLEDRIEHSKYEEAATLAEAFYNEHRPVPKAIDTLQLSSELWEKSKSYRKAALTSETLAQERRSLKQNEGALDALNHANALYLRLGDLAQSERVLERVIDWTTSPLKKREAIELYSEISSWYGHSDKATQAWSILTPFLNDKEKQDLRLKQLRFYEQYQPQKGAQLREEMVRKEIEPYFSQSLLDRAEKDCRDKKWSSCYQLTLKLNRPQIPKAFKSRARLLQSQILLAEYYNQGTKAPSERLSLVLSIKAEKFEKAIQLLNTLSTTEDQVAHRLSAVNELHRIYVDYAERLNETLKTADGSHPDVAALTSEIQKIIPILRERTSELESGQKELQKIAAQESKNPPPSKAAHGLSSLGSTVTGLKGSEFRVYLPTWEETIPQRPENEIAIIKKSCNGPLIEKLNSVSALGREANQCFKKGDFKNLEVIALRLSDLFPELPWGPYYLSLLSSQQKSFDRSLWYLKLAENRSQIPILNYEETRQSYVQSPRGLGLENELHLDATWNLAEEPQFLKTLARLEEQKCPEALEYAKGLRAPFWQTIGFKSVIQNLCGPSSAGPQRQISSESPTSN